MAADLYVRFCSNLNLLRTKGKYSDVSIQIGETIYHSHRVVLAAASSYFDAMFNFADTDSNDRPIVLQNIEVTAFENVLQFLYTQCAPEINICNLEELLFASNYLGIPEIEDACVRFIEKNVSIIDNEFVLQLLLFAHASNIDSLVSSLSHHIVENLHVFLRGDTFLKIPLDLLKNLLVCRQSYLLHIGRLIINEDVALDAVIRWTFDSPHREKKRKHFEELIGMIDMDRISGEYVEFCLSQYNLNICNAVEPQLNNVLSPGDRATDAAGPVLSESIPTLHAYVQGMYSKSMKIVSANRYKPHWFISCQRSCYDFADYKMESVVLSGPDRLYCLRVNCFSTVKDQIFCAYSSINASLVNSVKLLSTLPFELHSFDLTAAENSVYLYDLWMGRHSRIDEIKAASLGFNTEELYRGIYRYNCELDKWFPVPKMKSRTRDACMTTAFNMVYLIGGELCSRRFRAVEMGYVQAYDYRVSRWIKLPRTHKLYSGTAKCCSSPDGKVYVSDGFNVEVFDPVAGKWDLISDADDGERNERNFHARKMVFFENLLWLAGMTVGDAETNFNTNWKVAAYDLVSREWCTSELLNRSIMRPPSVGTPVVKNLVVFKPFSNYL